MQKGLEWTPIYLVIILAIAAILIFAIIKPMFQQAAEFAQQQGPTFLFIGSLLPIFKNKF